MSLAGKIQRQRDNSQIITLDMGVGINVHCLSGHHRAAGIHVFRDLSQIFPADKHDSSPPGRTDNPDESDHAFTSQSRSMS